MAYGFAQDTACTYIRLSVHEAMPQMLRMRSSMAAVGLAMALAMAIVSLWPGGPSLASGPGSVSRNLKATDIWGRFDVPSGVQQLQERMIPGECLGHQLGDRFKWMWQVTTDSLKEHWWRLLMVLLICVVLAAALYPFKRYQYELLRRFTDSDDAQISRGFGNAEVLFMVCLWVADMASDIYVAGTYYKHQMYVFACLLVGIWIGSGCLAFVRRFLDWERCDSSTNIYYWATGLNSAGQAKPGLKLFVLYVLQLEPVVVAWNAWDHGMTPELKEEKTMAALCEGAPSALLQLYALLVNGAEGNVFILSGSIALSILTIATGVDQGFASCLPSGKHFENTMLPKAAQTGLRCCDVFGRISTWALLGIAFRPLHAERHGIQQPYLPGIIALDLLMVGCIFKEVLDLRRWRDTCFEKRYFVGIICSLLGVFCCCYDMDLVRQLRLCRTLLAARFLQSLLALWMCSLVLSAKAGGECMDREQAVLPIALLSFSSNLCTFIVAASNDIALSCWARPLLPVIAGWRGGRFELAARLGVASQLVRFSFEDVEEEDLVAALCQAAEAGRLSVVKALFHDFGLPLTATSSGGETATHFAARAGHRELIEELKAIGCQHLEAADKQRQTPIYMAASNGHLEVVKFLHSSGCSLEAPDNDGRTPVYVAAFNGHLEVVKFLHSSGCSLEAPDNNGGTPVYVAASNGHLEVVKFLHSSGCSLEAADNDGKTPVYVAASNGHLEVVKFLHSSGCSLEAAHNDGRTPVYVAAFDGHLEVVKFLHSSGCSLEAPDNDGGTPVIVAAFNGRLEVVKFLHSSGCSLEAPDNDGRTPVYVAAFNGHLEVVKFLHSSGCSLEAPDNDGGTPVHIAAECGHLEVVKFLHSFGCQVHVSHLHAAVQQKHVETVKFLLAASVDVNARGLGGARALDVAQTAGSESNGSVIEALVRAGAVPGPRPRLLGLTALKPAEPPPHGFVWLTCGLPEAARAKGKLYYEVQFLSDFEQPQVGWLSTEFVGGHSDGRGVGDDCHSWAFDGHRYGWWHDGFTSLSISKWAVQDAVGLAIDLDHGQMQLYTKRGKEAAMSFECRGELHLA